MKIFIFYLILSALLLLASCESSKKSSMKPPAGGDKGEMILVMDSVKWKGKLGDKIKSLFKQKVPGLPQNEPLYTVRYIEPHSFKGLLRHHRNIVIVTTFDQKTVGSLKLQRNFTKESVRKLKATPDLFWLVKKDEYARNQVVMHIFSNDERTLVQHIDKNFQSLQQYFNTVEKNRLLASFRKIRGNEKLMQQLSAKHGFSFELLKGYKVVRDTTRFLWLRFPEANIDKNLFFTYQPYLDENQFTLENIIAWRNKIGKAYLTDPEHLNRYIITETLTPVLEKVTTINGSYAKELRGLWRIKTRFVGGAFRAYVFVDQTRNRIYYTEGFAIAPGTEKREIMRELAAVLTTFKPMPTP